MELKGGVQSHQGSPSWGLAAAADQLHNLFQLNTELTAIDLYLC